MSLCGPLLEPSVGRSVYVATRLYDFSKLSFMRLLACKTDDVLKLVKTVLTCIETQSAHRCHVVLIEMGTVYVDSDYFTT